MLTKLKAVFAFVLAISWLLPPIVLPFYLFSGVWLGLSLAWAAFTTFALLTVFKDWANMTTERDPRDGR